MKILSAASELYPLVKTGGLADVLGALPVWAGLLTPQGKALRASRALLTTLLPVGDGLLVSVRQT
mgnify:CR=1 FL=1